VTLEGAKSITNQMAVACAASTARSPPWSAPGASCRQRPFYHGVHYDNKIEITTASSRPWPQARHHRRGHHRQVETKVAAKAKREKVTLS